MAAAINPYLNFDGNAEEAFNFYKSVFGGEIEMIMRYKDAPPEHQMGETNGEKIMHISLPIGKNNMLMASDTPAMYGQTIFGTNFSITVSTDSEAEAEKIFNGLSAGGKITMGLEKVFWGSYFGMLTDKFGVSWMVSYDYNQPK